MILRHDVDLSLDAALRMAELEADAGAAATYFLMTGSVFYNLGSEEGERALGRLRELGHRVGLHAVYPRLDLDDRFDPVIAWHNPDPEYMRSPVEGAINVMEPPWFDPETYRSDSNQHWRSGCPHEELRASAFPWLQLLTHPEIWVYPGTRWARRCARCSRRRRSAASSSSPPTGSTSRDRGGAPRRRFDDRCQDRRHGSPGDRPVERRCARTAPPLRACRLRRRTALPRHRRAGARDPHLRRRRAGARAGARGRPSRLGARPPSPANARGTSRLRAAGRRAMATLSRGETDRRSDLP